MTLEELLARGHWEHGYITHGEEDYENWFLTEPSLVNVAKNKDKMIVRYVLPSLTYEEACALNLLPEQHDIL